MVDPKDVFQQGANLSPEDLQALKEAGISGTVRLGDFAADFLSIKGETLRVNLTSAGVWLGVTSEERDYVLFVEQADRLLRDGDHPWELPSGRTDPHIDQNIFQTLIREVLEETGITLTNALPIAIAIKREQDGIPDITIVPTANNEIWIHGEDEMKKLAAQGDLEGGLICISRIAMEDLAKLGVQKLDQRADGSIIFAPPPGVDSGEISRLSLEPLNNIMNGDSEFIPKTSHMWAQADAFRAFLLKLHSE